MKVYATTGDAYQLFHDGILAFSEAESVGLRIDVSYCEEKKEELSDRISELESEFGKTDVAKQWKRIYGRRANYNSNDQLAKILFDHMAIRPVSYTEKGRPSTNNESLQQLQVPGLGLVLKSRKLKKIRDTYLDGLLREQVDGILRPFFNLHLARTFRSSSDHINFQNIPKRDKEAQEIVRRAILPHEGCQLIEVDFSGIEVRVSVCYHKDPAMIVYINDKTTDMHRDMAQQIYILSEDEWTDDTRFYAKNGFVFPEFYGDYYVSCARAMWKAIEDAHLETRQGIPLKRHLRSKGIRSYDDFEDHMKKVEEHFWGERFPVYNEWKERQWKRYLKRGYLDLYTGFRCSGVMGRNETSNYPIQGSAFHCLLWSFIEVQRILVAERWKSRLVGQIHDSMVSNTHPDEREDLLALIKEITCKRLQEHWPWIIVPMEVEADLCPVDAPWNEKQKEPI